MHVVVALGLASTGCLRIGFLRLALELACASGHCGLGACEPRTVLLTVCGVVYVCVLRADGTSVCVLRADGTRHADGARVGDAQQTRRGVCVCGFAALRWWWRAAEKRRDGEWAGGDGGNAGG